MPNEFNQDEILEIDALYELLQKKVGAKLRAKEDIDLKDLQIYLTQIDKFAEGPNREKWLNCLKSENAEDYGKLSELQLLQANLLLTLQTKNDNSKAEFLNKNEYKSKYPFQVKNLGYVGMVGRENKLYLLEGDYLALLDETCAKYEKELNDFISEQANIEEQAVVLNQEDIEKQTIKIAETKKEYNELKQKIDDTKAWLDLYKSFDDKGYLEKKDESNPHYREFNQYKKNPTYLYSKSNDMSNYQTRLDDEMSKMLELYREEARNLLTREAKENQKAKIENRIHNKTNELDSTIAAELEQKIQEIKDKQIANINKNSEQFNAEVQLQKKVINGTLFSPNDLTRIEVAIEKITNTVENIDNRKPIPIETFQVVIGISNKFRNEHTKEWEIALDEAENNKPRGEVYENILRLERMRLQFEEALKTYNDERLQKYNQEYPERVPQREFYHFTVNKKSFEEMTPKNIQHLVTKDYFQYAIDLHCQANYEEYKNLVIAAARERDTEINNLRVNVDKKAIKRLMDDEAYKNIEAQEKELEKQKVEIQKRYKDDQNARTRELDEIKNQETQLNNSKNERMHEILKVTDQEVLREIGGQIQRIQDNYANKMEKAYATVDSKITEGVLKDYSNRLKACNERLIKNEKKFYKEKMLNRVLEIENEKGIQHNQEDLDLQNAPIEEPVFEDNIYLKDILEKPKTKMEQYRDLCKEELEVYESDFYNDEMRDWSAQEKQFDRINALHSLLKKQTKINGNSKEFNDLIKELDVFHKGLVEAGWYDGVAALWRSKNGRSGVSDEMSSRLSDVFLQLKRVYKAGEKYLVAKGPQRKYWGHGQARYDLTYLLCSTIYNNGGKVALGKANIKRVEKDIAAGKQNLTQYIPQIIEQGINTTFKKYEEMIQTTIRGTQNTLGTKAKIEQERRAHKDAKKPDIIINTNGDDAIDIDFSSLKKVDDNKKAKEMNMNDIIQK